LLSGLIGIGFTYLISIPINLILSGLIANMSSIVTLNVLDAVVLVVISFVLTLIAGIIPSRAAAKKDPVVALRTE
jgi:putative ABC transport system permease protein